jgi:2,5-diketo-D-gluconate reductase B
MNVLFQRTHQRSFGTWPLQGRQLHDALAAAIETGYRAIDTAQLYDNEIGVGSALRAIGVPRDELCITTKIAPANDSDERFMPTLRESLDKLKVEQVDMLLLHWPPADGDVGPSVRRLEQAQRAGLTRHIGVSNFTAAMMRAARAATALPLVTNQVEFHPLLDQRILLRAATETGIPLSSYCSVARGEVFKYPLFGEIGAQYGKSAAQVALRWLVQQGFVALSKTAKPERIAENIAIFDFALSDADMTAIAQLARPDGRLVSPAGLAPAWDA